MKFRGPQALIGQGRKSRSCVENKAVTGRTFMKFRGPEALMGQRWQISEECCQVEN